MPENGQGARVIARASARGCHLGSPDVEAQALARTALIAAETIATEDNGFYTRVSRATIHSTEPTIPITRRAARGGAYLLAASGNRDSYFLTVIASDGNTFSAGVTANGKAVRLARECGAERHW